MTRRSLFDRAADATAAWAKRRKVPAPPHERLVYATGWLAGYRAAKATRRRGR